MHKTTILTGWLAGEHFSSRPGSDLPFIYYITELCAAAKRIKPLFYSLADQAQIPLKKNCFATLFKNALTLDSKHQFCTRRYICKARSCRQGRNYPYAKCAVRCLIFIRAQLGLDLNRFCSAQACCKSRQGPSWNGGRSVY
jgi:hypothetical protein